MRIRVMSWNMAGAKLLDKLAAPPDPVAAQYIAAYGEVWRTGIRQFLTVPGNQPEYPDVILLQECIGFEDHSPNPSGRWQTGSAILEGIFQGYRGFFFPSLSSRETPHPRKWEMYQRGCGVQNLLPDYVEGQQGYGICIRDPSQLRKLYIPYRDPTTAPSNADVPGGNAYHLCFERTAISTGAYLGTRDTEPRLAIRGRLFIDSGAGEGRYINFLNVHLTTLSGERTGKIRINRRAAATRSQQVELILDNIVSAYQETAEYRVPPVAEDRKEDVWLMGGDFNATPDTDEIATVKRAGFVDGTTDKRLTDAYGTQLNHQIGTKWSLDDTTRPAIVLDYIFCGLERIAFPSGRLDCADSRPPYRPRFPGQFADFQPDHAVMFCSFNI